jgi:hypothetical protein
MQIFVMPAWIAGIQVCKDASGNIHVNVNLDSITPCWNGAIKAVCMKSRRPYFKKRTRGARRIAQESATTRESFRPRGNCAKGWWSRESHKA